MVSLFPQYTQYRRIVQQDKAGTPFKITGRRGEGCSRSKYNLRSPRRANTMDEWTLHTSSDERHLPKNEDVGRPARAGEQWPWSLEMPARGVVGGDNNTTLPTLCPTPYSTCHWYCTDQALRGWNSPPFRQNFHSNPSVKHASARERSWPFLRETLVLLLLD